MKSEFYKPVFIIGGVRSGTSILGDILRQQSDVAYWLEPKYIWKYRKAKADNDIRGSEDATTHIKEYIRGRFYKYMSSHGASRFMEKTPSNVFRVPFIHEIFPNGLFIRLIRNGHHTILSTYKKWTTPIDRTAVTRRLRSNEIPLRDLPYYGMATVRDVIGRTVLPKAGFIWGQQFENIKDYRDTHTIMETCAMQWVKAMQHVDNAIENIPEEQIYEIRYEELVSNPEQILLPLLDFLEYRDVDRIIDWAKQNVNDYSSREHDEETKKSLREVDYIIREEMNKWGYN
jgi:hypothetical protein